MTVDPTTTDPVQAVLDRLDDVWVEGDRQWIARCPAHEDRKPSLSIGVGDDGKVLLHCQADCSLDEVLAAMNPPMTKRELFASSNGSATRRNDERKIVATYDYRDTLGVLLFQVVRYDPKDFRQRRPDGKGEWIWNLKGVERVLYRLQELTRAPDHCISYDCEGEKDADRLAAEGMIATTNPGGAGKWSKVDDTPLHGRHVVILPHNDDQGHKHAQDVASRLHGKAASVRVVELPGLDEHGDVSDWLDAGNDPADLDQLAANAPEWELAKDKTEAVCSTAHSTDDVIERPDPIPLAESFINTHYRDTSGRLLLRRHRGDFYSFAGACYESLSDEEIGASLYRHLEQCWTIQRDKSGEPVRDKQGRSKLRPIVPKRSMIREVELALPSRGVLLDHRRDPPYWLSARDDLDPMKLVPCRNGLLDLSTRTLHPSTPDLFSTHALPFDFDPDAPDPIAWLAFLDQLWETDLEAWRASQMWFGYCLVANTKQHKILMICGPKRSGKGTIGRIMTALLGIVNVAAPALGSLATNFGLQPLLGKLLAIVSDARLSGRTDQAVVVERLLSISGEDLQTVDCKFKPQVTCKLPTRYMLLTNELPRLRDTSGALPSRFIILTLTESWFGREDHDLTDKLLAELPGIFNWAIDGWAELQERGRFTQPRSSEDAIRELEDLSSPTGAFVRDRCETGPGCSVACDEIYRAWKAWCTEQGRDRPGTVQTFGRDLHAAVPGLKLRKLRDNEGRVGTYEGITLADHALTQGQQVAGERDW